MIIAADTLQEVTAAIRVAQRREQDGDMRGALLYVLTAQKLLLVCQAKLAETAIYPEDTRT